MEKEYSFPFANIKIDYQRGVISSLAFQGEEMIEGEASFFILRLRDHDNNYHYLKSKDFSFVEFKDNQAFYHHEELDVALRIENISNGLKWGIKVINHTSLLLEQVEIMSLGLHKDLMDEGGKGEIDIPYNEGARVTLMKRREECAFRYYDVDYPSQGIFFMYPNMISSPFMSYIHKGHGIFLGMLDKSGTPKHIDFHVDEGILKTVMSVFTNVNYGEDYEMPFDSVMIFFKGDYFDACDIYRQWFDKNIASNFIKIKDQFDNLPKWYHESPVVITYPVVGTRDSDTEMKPGGLYPYTNGLPVIDYYSKKMDSKVMVLLMQWESTAPWAPPYVWPPYGDMDNFNEYMAKLHQNGHYLGVYTSGFGWTNKSFRREYDKTEEFEKENLKTIMCTNSDGSMRSTVVSDIRFGYDVCPSQERGKLLFIEEAKKMIDSGLDYVQILDQNHGGNPYFCYSDKHGHVPAPGSWQVDETLKLLRRINRPNCLLGCESAASEPYIGELLFSDNRYILNYYIGEPIPMYAYLYHEYVNNFMGNQICYPLSDEYFSLPYRIAYSFICGDMFTLVIDGNGKLHNAWCYDPTIDDTLSLIIINNLNKWRTGKFMEYLHLGRMVKPLPYQTDIMKMGFKWGDHIFKFPAVLSSAFTNEKETYQFFANYDNKIHAITLEDKDYEVVLTPDGQTKTLNGLDIIVPPLSAIAIKIK